MRNDGGDVGLNFNLIYISFIVFIFSTSFCGIVSCGYLCFFFFIFVLFNIASFLALDLFNEQK